MGCSPFPARENEYVLLFFPKKLLWLGFFSMSFGCGGDVTYLFCLIFSMIAVRVLSRRRCLDVDADGRKLDCWRQRCCAKVVFSQASPKL